MSTLIVGDVQGCFDELQRGLAKAGFDPARDVLWAVGDIVNRGPASLATLRFFHALGDRAQIVLGNHDLHLLSLAEGLRSPKRGDTVQDILNAPDASELLGWLRQQPLLHVDESSRSVMVHAGLPPCWTLGDARRHAAEVEQVLRHGDYRALLAAMYGNHPDHWDERLQGLDRYRVIINYLTRMRFCTANGQLELTHKGPPEEAPAGFSAWFGYDNASLQGWQLFFGHWATLQGRCHKPGWHALDTGCVWGRHLTLYRLEDGQVFTT